MTAPGNSRRQFRLFKFRRWLHYFLIWGGLVAATLLCYLGTYHWWYKGRGYSTRVGYGWADRVFGPASILEYNSAAKRTRDYLEGDWVQVDRNSAASPAPPRACLRLRWLREDSEPGYWQARVTARLNDGSLIESTLRTLEPMPSERLSHLLRFQLPGAVTGNGYSGQLVNIVHGGLTADPPGYVRHLTVHHGFFPAGEFSGVWYAGDDRNPAGDFDFELFPVPGGGAWPWDTSLPAALRHAPVPEVDSLIADSLSNWGNGRIRPPLVFRRASRDDPDIAAMLEILEKRSAAAENFQSEQTR